MRTAPFFAVGALISVADLIFNRSQGVGGLGYSLIEARPDRRARGVVLRRQALVAGPTWASSTRTGRCARPTRLGWAALAAAVAVVAVLWMLRRRIGRGPLAGVLFFGITLSPTLGFVDYNFMLFSFVADRYQYLASIGVIAVIIGAAGHGVAAAFRAGRLWTTAASAVLAVTLLGVLGTLTWRQATLYHDGITFFNHVIAHHPRAREAHLNLGSALLRWNRLEEALAAYSRRRRAPPRGLQAAVRRRHRALPPEPARRSGGSVSARPGALPALRRRPRRPEHAAARSAALRRRAGIVRGPPPTSSPTVRRHGQTAASPCPICGRGEEALESLDRALALDPHQQQAQDARARILRESTGP